MNHKIWVNHLLGAVFAFLLSMSAVGNLVTGYDLTVKSTTALFVLCACFSVVSALLFRLKHGGKILTVLIVLAIPFFWRNGALWDQLQSISYRISLHYHEVYNWSIIGKPITNTAELPMIVLSACCAFSVSWTYCRRKHLITILPSVFLPLVLCLITTDRVPDAIYLYLLIVSMALLLVTDWARRHQPVHEISITLRLMIPIAVSIAILFTLNPQEEYVNHAGEFQKEVVSWFQNLRDTYVSLSSGSTFESATSQKLNLKYVGPKRKSTRTVMRANAPIDGIIYLRGRDYDRYTGKGWESTLGRHETFPSGTGSLGTLSVITYGVKDVLYIPYYATDKIRLENGALDNNENLQKYSYSLSDSVSSGSAIPDSIYTELPLDTLQWASGLDVIINTTAASNLEKVLRIKDYVQNSAVYDLSTARMDTEYDDFVQWFLEESDTGYCVHFATTATVLLRAAGIPARYVEGYMVTCRAGEETVVQVQHAHAWTEYYDFDSGVWRLLEATPADLTQEPSESIIMTFPTETTPTPTDTELTTHEETTTYPHNIEKTEPKDQENLTDNIADPTGNKEFFKIPDWFWSIFKFLIVMAVIPLQSQIRMDWKRKQWNRGLPNEKTITRWRQTKQIANLLKIPFPMELESLAQKANFSQHRIQPEELQLFANFRNKLLDIVRSRPWHQRIFWRWIFAIGE